MANIEFPAANVRTLRLKAGLSQEELARYLNVTQGAISQWESPSNATRMVTGAAAKLLDAAMRGVWIECDQEQTA